MAKFLFYDDMLINVMLKNEKPSGGAAVQSYAWIRGLLELGHDVDVLTNQNSSDEIKDEYKKISINQRRLLNNHQFHHPFDHQQQQSGFP